jgi:hypothetical protein
MSAAGYDYPEHRLVRSCIEVHHHPKCMGAAAMGPERCTCSHPEASHEQCVVDAWADHESRGGEMCFDCAFRKGSPEEGMLAELAARQEPFRCHQGMPIEARSGTPEPGNYRPRLVVLEGRIVTAPDYPVCEGWLRARRALLAREAVQ